jgi:hypothetical protein
METDALRQIRRFPNHLSWQSCVQLRFGAQSLPLPPSLPQLMRGAHAVLVLA